MFLICSEFLSLAKNIHLKKHVFSLLKYDLNSKSTSTSPKRSVNKMNAMLNVLLFSSHFTLYTNTHTLSLLQLQLLEKKNKKKQINCCVCSYSRYDASDFTVQIHVCILKCMLKDGLVYSMRQCIRMFL